MGFVARARAFDVRCKIRTNTYANTHGGNSSCNGASDMRKLRGAANVGMAAIYSRQNVWMRTICTFIHSPLRPDHSLFDSSAPQFNETISLDVRADIASRPPHAMLFIFRCVCVCVRTTPFHVHFVLPKNDHVVGLADRIHSVPCGVFLIKPQPSCVHASHTHEHND